MKNIAFSEGLDYNNMNLEGMFMFRFPGKQPLIFTLFGRRTTSQLVPKTISPLQREYLLAKDACNIFVPLLNEVLSISPNQTVTIKNQEGQNEKLKLKERLSNLDAKMRLLSENCEQPHNISCSDKSNSLEQTCREYSSELLKMVNSFVSTLEVWVDKRFQKTQAALSPIKCRSLKNDPEQRALQVKFLSLKTKFMPQLRNLFQQIIDARKGIRDQRGSLTQEYFNRSMKLFRKEVKSFSEAFRNALDANRQNDKKQSSKKASVPLTRDTHQAFHAFRQRRDESFQRQKCREETGKTRKTADKAPRTPFGPVPRGPGSGPIAAK